MTPLGPDFARALGIATKEAGRVVEPPPNLLPASQAAVIPSSGCQGLPARLRARPQELTSTFTRFKHSGLERCWEAEGGIRVHEQFGQVRQSQPIRRR